jgi:hypothetical protein
MVRGVLLTGFSVRVEGDAEYENDDDVPMRADIKNRPRILDVRSARCECPLVNERTLPCSYL